MGKKELREHFRARRDALPAVVRRTKSRVIGNLLRRLPQYRRAKTVMFFVTHCSEVCTEPMIARALKDKKKVAVPSANTETCALSAARITSLANDLEFRTYGIREPKKTVCAPVSPGDIDLVLVPALAFDRRGQRIGYGKGYYDRWLKRFPRSKRVGLAFGCQIADRGFPRSIHDVPVGVIVTEQGILNTKKGASKCQRRICC